MCGGTAAVEVYDEYIEFTVSLTLARDGIPQDAYTDTDTDTDTDQEE